MCKCGDDETSVVFMNHDCSWATDVNLNYCSSMQADNRWTLSLTDATYEQMFAGGTGSLGAMSWIHWSTLFLNSLCKKNWWRQRWKVVAGMREWACPLAIWPFPPHRHQKNITVKRESDFKNILMRWAQLCTMMTVLNLNFSLLTKVLVTLFQEKQIKQIKFRHYVSQYVCSASAHYTTHEGTAGRRAQHPLMLMIHQEFTVE